MAQAMSRARPPGRMMEMAGLAAAIGQSAAQVVWAVSHAPAAGTATRIQSPGMSPGRDQIGQWPLQSSLELSAVPSAVPCARLHVRQMLRGWGLASLSDDAGLVTSELVTNAVTATCTVGRPAPVRLWLRADGGGVLILVWDCSPKSPGRMDVDGDAEAGRGLALVDAISDRWDWYVPQGTGRKVVWALLQGHDSR
jgi:anti-sigma regulatory factor (Ser/Thr protein kinase)